MTRLDQVGRSDRSATRERGGTGVADRAEIGVFGGSGFYCAARRRPRDQGRHAVRPAVGQLLPRRRRAAARSPSCRATAAATRSRRTRSTTGPTSGRCARSGSRRSSARARPARSSATSKPGDFVVCDQFVDRTNGRGRHVLRRPDRHPRQLRRDLRPGPAPDRDRDDPRPRHPGPRAGHGGGDPGTALLDQGRVEVVLRRRLGGHQHDPVPRGVSLPRARAWPS